ncbi:hypothetical protein A1O1_05654 [Capronia coronata CBS 617.96]|uniref:Uncharacterized protein n=1 Tax=Capronia coronata CBS 617.96 TaxID=1182541 RepID=W9Y7A0_9EURO|nr:uncharacterized protein A1O1_05654 [Capronia coronata CBS 617.96]EXJ88722.1 hypothetical protein A1O1_05654 [Capronia coronata CBS 617.96]
MCFRTEINDPTQQPVRISQSEVTGEDGKQVSSASGQTEDGKKEQSNVAGHSKGHKTHEAMSDTEIKPATTSETARPVRTDRMRRRGNTSSMLALSMDFGASPV